MLRKLLFSVIALVGAVGMWGSTLWPSTAHASCGAVTCFVVIGSQQQVSPAGILTTNLMYNYTPSSPGPEGANTIPFANQQTKQLILGNTQVDKLETLVQTAALNLNYGLTERFGLEVMLPYKWVQSIGQFGPGTVSNYDNNGLGDVMARLKYNMLPTLRSMFVLDMAVYFPTGTYQQTGPNGQYAESTLQLGRGAFGFQPGFYQTYEILPHRLNQFSQGTWRYSLRNSDGYQFGQEFSFNAGFNIVTVPWLVLTEQINFRYKTQDSMDAALYQFVGPPIDRALPVDLTVTSRSVPTTNFTFVGFSTGLLVNLWDYAQAYFIAQIPIYRDFNGNLQQDTSFVAGVTRSFQVLGGS
ncbi:MAG: transporter [Nitrospira sp.]|nr:transporter [Nitrospira sp.]